MKKLIYAATACLVTLALLLLMTGLIAQPQAPMAKIKAVKPAPQVLPSEKDPAPQEPVNIIKPSISVLPSIDANEDIQVELQAMVNLETLDFSPVKTDFIGLINAPNSTDLGLVEMDQEAIPLIQTAPAYPADALIQGIEGWVKLTFDVDASGFAKNIKVVSASHRKIFDREAKKALKKWKFKPGKRGGIDKGLDNQSVTMQFNLTDN
ncbi:energy transducer TonB [Kangiella sp. HZ709]|uniref:energy transducer TonB n=1 Tax=Kangiella sp. HZ709 TaxID=2666328 RepID=UPI0018A226EF|nr:energy transducer TonB [Kangiella sp. HZ709]